MTVEQVDVATLLAAQIAYRRDAPTDAEHLFDPEVGVVEFALDVAQLAAATLYPWAARRSPEPGELIVGIWQREWVTAEIEPVATAFAQVAGGHVTAARDTLAHSELDASELREIAVGLFTVAWLFVRHGWPDDGIDIDAELRREIYAAAAGGPRLT